MDLTTGPTHLQTAHKDSCNMVECRIAGKDQPCMAPGCRTGRTERPAGTFRLTISSLKPRVEYGWLHPFARGIVKA
jgi:hypothetical protein